MWQAELECLACLTTCFRRLTFGCMCVSVSVVLVSSLIRLSLLRRAPQWAAASSAGRRARGSGRGCGFSSKTRCSTPSQRARWGGTESPAPAPKLSWLLKNELFLAVFLIFYAFRLWGKVTFSLFRLSHTHIHTTHCVWLTKGLSVLSLQPSLSLCCYFAKECWWECWPLIFVFYLG